MCAYCIMTVLCSQVEEAVATSSACMHLVALMAGVAVVAYGHMLPSALSTVLS